MIKIPIEVSARHVHLSRKDLDKLFGKGYQLTKIKNLSQPEQFAAKETITIKGKRGEIKNVRILGPVRQKTQVEISKTDAINLKIEAPVRLSGNLKNSGGCILIGPKGKIKLKEGVIIAWRHLHIEPKLAKKYNLKNGQFVSIKVKNTKRSLTFHNVIVRVSPKFRLAFQIDTDEANAAGIDKFGEGELIKDR
ncbi:phosphate propanoyltransferase [bacterium]|nr:phosphate propanoyltransferase [bacterium]